jgi:hypothetical protein
MIETSADFLEVFALDGLNFIHTARRSIELLILEWFTAGKLPVDP